MFTEHLENTPKWNFDALYSNSEKTREFIEEYKTEKAKQFDIDRENIVMTGLVEGSIKTKWTSIKSSER